MRPPQPPRGPLGRQITSVIVASYAVTVIMGRMPFMYILECSDRTLYVGSTWDLGRRLAQHQEGEGAEYTRNRLPVRLLYSEHYSRIENAFLREKQVQRLGTGETARVGEGTTREAEALEP